VRLDTLRIRYFEILPRDHRCSICTSCCGASEYLFEGDEGCVVAHPATPTIRESVIARTSHLAATRLPPLDEVIVVIALVLRFGHPRQTGIAQQSLIGLRPE